MCHINKEIMVPLSWLPRTNKAKMTKNITGSRSRERAGKANWLKISLALGEKASKIKLTKNITDSRRVSLQEKRTKNITNSRKEKQKQPRFIVQLKS